MNAVPRLFVEAVVRHLDEDSLCSLKAFSSGNFGKLGRSLWENRLRIYFNVVFNRKAGNFDYCLTCIRNDSFSEEPYTYDPADRRFVSASRVHLLKSKDLDYIDLTWTTAAPSDPTLLWWLRAPFARTSLYLYVNCPQFLNLLPDYCTFNRIHTDSVYSKVYDAIIERSQECGRLEDVDCTEFFKKRGREASIEWILRNKRLRSISGWNVCTPAAIENALNSIDVR